MTTTNSTESQARFYNAITVRNDMQEALEERHRDWDSDMGALDRIAAQNRHNKSALNNALFGNPQNSFSSLALIPTATRIAKAFPYSIAFLQNIAGQVDLEVSNEIVKANTLPNGAKFSRTLLRKLGDTQNRTISLLGAYDSAIRQELPNMPEREKCFFNVFLQNFYSGIAAFKAQINISTDIYDIVTASEYTGGWKSCYRWNSGSQANYASSTIIRALDSRTAMVFLTQTNSINKVGRFWLTLSEQFNQFAVFPAYGDFSPINVKRACQFVIDSLAQNLGIENTWESIDVEKNRYGNGHFGESFFRSVAYIDVPAFAYATKPLETGYGFYATWPKAQCVDCGQEHNEHSLLCEDCQQTAQVTCVSCGERMSEGEDYYDQHADESLCESCYRDRFVRCRNCGEDIYASDDDTQYVNGNHYCGECFNDNFATCDHCGDIERHSDMTSVEDGYVCDYCLRRNYSQCEDCSDYFRTDDMVDTAIGHYCQCCYDYALENDTDAEDGLMARELEHIAQEYDTFRAIDNARFSFPKCSMAWSISVNDRVIFRHLSLISESDRNASPCLVGGMQHLFNGFTRCRVYAIGYMLDNSERFFTIIDPETQDTWQASSRWVQEHMPS